MDPFMHPMAANTQSASGGQHSGSGQSSGQPYVRIVEQPAKCALRFRYECEGRSAGSIPASTATADNKTYPTIQVCNYKGQAVVVVSCVTKDTPYRPHPHNLVGKEGCKKGVCTMVINNHDMIQSFTSLGIQCVKRKDIEDSLKLRESIKVDPYRTGFSHKSQSSSIDLNVVRLCFQVFIEGPEKDKFTVQLPPIVSDPIYDKKAMTELIITKLSHCSAPCSGGKEVILLCDRVTKDDIQVRFFQEHNGQVVWDAFADFGPGDVHKQVAICFRTPRYYSENLTQAVSVQLQLRRPSDGCLSDARVFQILPKEVDPDGLTRKRQKIDEGFERFLRDNSLSVSSPPTTTAPTGIASPVSPKREVIHVPRITNNIKLEPLNTIQDTQQLQALSTSSMAQTSWSANPSQFISLSQIPQQIGPQMDVLLSQEYRQPPQISSQQSSQTLSQCSTQSEFLLPNIPNAIDMNATKSSKGSTTLTQLLTGQSALVGIDLNTGFTFNNANMINTSNTNTNTSNMNANAIQNVTTNCNTIADEVMEKFDSLGLEGIDTSELLPDINFNSFNSTMMSDIMGSGPIIGSIGNSRENLLNSRDNILVTSTLQTPDVNTITDNSRNLMSNPQQMQRLQTKLITLGSNRNINDDINDKINNN
ncbi:unnamed protein product [Medioppia subpectinata]|uniref:RHD domain-containing protein n=1 Tax=Medioppia subpectinata TaxID=1979941 RepID=A0A7R9KV44_9ACAR|nr:unnamed protein product [Medioppia subpectinata]CAG2110442.1 unnamed protein product [Medioppia subpectinata]